MFSLIEKSSILLIINTIIIIVLNLSIQQISLLESVVLGSIWTTVFLGCYILINRSNWLS